MKKFEVVVRSTDGLLMVVVISSVVEMTILLMAAFLVNRVLGFFWLGACILKLIMVFVAVVMHELGYLDIRDAKPGEKCPSIREKE